MQGGAGGQVGSEQGGKAETVGPGPHFPLSGLAP